MNKQDSQIDSIHKDRSFCNYAKGKWVADKKRPLYSGSECKHWLSSMWACRLMDRPDFSFEGYRWQPRGCNMPQFDRFTFLTSSSLSDLVPMNNTDPPRLTAMHLDRPPASMRTYLHRFDLLVLNTGHHWNKSKIEGNHWVMHVKGTRVKGEFFKDIGHAKAFTIRSAVKWLDAQLPLHPRLKAFFQTISPRHFRNCNNTVPLSRGSEIRGDYGSMDKTVESAVNGTRIKILDITALSELRDEAHISGSKLIPRKPKKVVSNVTSTAPTVNDCLHWCLPGIPDTWNELFIAQIKKKYSKTIYT
ncbi:hypothetical protein Bca4012_053150 [Brassica carinata]